ncbi:MAG: amino acid adenylation domain-containing protein, partial [Magnetococcales bacterium]|nr:amino acid adenylation domain-containing protein [Magnetococcales bacterium]
PAGLTITHEEVDARISRFDLVFEFFEREGGLQLSLTYNTNLFEAGRITRLIAQLEQLLIALGKTPETALERLEILPEAERILLWSGQRRQVDHPRTTLVERFAAQVRATPQAIAIIEAGESCDYRQLAAWSDRLAHHLRTDHRLRPEEIVPLVADRSAGFYAGLLAILKAGGACLPIDAATPAPRIAFMLQDSGARFGLIGGDIPPPASDRESPFAWLPVDRWRTGADSDASPEPTPPVTAERLAYVIYTSGSTGQPKGVLVEHGGFVNMALAQIDAFSVTAEDRVLQFASPSFDACMSEIFMALLCGAALVPTGQRLIQNPERLLDHLGATGVTVATLPPVYLHTLTTLARERNRQELFRLKTLITAGEPPVFEDALHYAAQVGYFNAYGPTETSVCTSLHRVEPDPGRYPGGIIPIGPPLDNLSVFLLDGAFELAPLGTPGEIAVAGPGVARGYLNRPELTAERFVPNPWQPGTRLYRTGDLGRWRSDHTLELLGRLDEQIKIRGNRVEPGEVIHHLLQHPEVREATVLVENAPGRPPELIGCVTPEGLAPERLRAWLEPILPGYMIPGRWVVTDRLPLTLNGKIDRKALLTQAADARHATRLPTPPRTPLETRLLQVWKKVLDQSEIGIEDDFFVLGGDSIKAIQVVAALGEPGLETKALFLHPTIAALAQSLERQPRTPRPLAEQGPVTGTVPLTAIQAWFFRDYPNDHHHFNHGEYLFFPQRLDESALKEALQAVQRHHDLLRARFRPDDTGAMLQEIAGVELEVDFRLVDLRDAEDPEAQVDHQTLTLQSGMDLTQGPLFKTRLFRLEQEDRLLFVIHHLIIDAVSWRFLLEDILQGYEQRREGRPITLPPKSDSFQRWAEGIRAYSRSPQLLQELDYWQKIEAIPVPPLPSSGARPPGADFDLQDQQLALTPEETRALRATTQLQAAPCALGELLLAALAQSLQAWSGIDRIPILLEGHGREPVLPGVEVHRTVGWLTTVFPFVLAAPPGQTLAVACRNIRKQLDALPR